MPNVNNHAALHKKQSNKKICIHSCVVETFSAAGVQREPTNRVSVNFQNRNFTPPTPPPSTFNNTQETAGPRTAYFYVHTWTVQGRKITYTTACAAPPPTRGKKRHHNTYSSTLHKVKKNSEPSLMYVKHPQQFFYDQNTAILGLRVVRRPVNTK